MRRAGTKILDLTESNPTACGLQAPAATLRALSNKTNRLYRPDARGSLQAREAIARYYAEQGIRVSPDRLLLTASTSEAYSFLLKLLANPGDRVLFPKPSYPLLDHLAQVNDVQMDKYTLAYDGTWHVDGSLWQHPFAKNTRAIVVIHPNNPTGSYLKREEWDRLVHACAQNNCAIISDEVFLERMPSLIAQKTGVLTFALGGISKMLGLPQMKVAWIAVNGPSDAVREAMRKLEMIADTYLSVNTPAQNALPLWMRQRKSLFGRVQRRIARNRAMLEAMDWGSLGCELLHAEGGWYAILRVPALRSEEEGVLRLLGKRHALVHPGYFFDFEHGAHWVLSLLPETKDLREGLMRMREELGA